MELHNVPQNFSNSVSYVECTSQLECILTCLDYNTRYESYLKPIYGTTNSHLGSLDIA